MAEPPPGPALKFAFPVPAPLPSRTIRQALSPWPTNVCQPREASAGLPFIQAAAVNGVLPVGLNCGTKPASAKVMTPSLCNDVLAAKPAIGTPETDGPVPPPGTEFGL